MRVKWTAVRIIQAVLAIAFLGVGLPSLWMGFQNDRDFEVWGEHRLMEGPVDLSVSGEWTFSCVQISRIPHSALLRLKLPEEFQAKDREELVELMAPLEATLTVGPEVESNMPLLLEHRSSSDKLVPLFRIPLLGNGTHETTLKVLQSVPALKGVPQRIEGRYRLCGCEGIVGFALKGIGGFLTVIGLVPAFDVLRWLRKEKKALPADVSAETASTDEAPRPEA